MSGFLTWFDRDLWQPLWPNLAASGICATLAVLRVRAHLDAHHDRIRRLLDRRDQQ